MNIGMKLSFLKASVGGEFYEYLFKKYILKSEPWGFTKGISNGKPWDEKKHMKVISKASAGERISTIGKRGTFSINENGLRTPHQSIFISQESDIFMPTEEDMQEAVNYSNCFVAGYIFNAEYVIVQSSESETLYNQRDIPQEILNTIKNTPYKLGVWDDKQYDTRFNPGNWVTIANTHLMAAWKMWFGAPFFDMVPKEKLLAFPHAVEVKELVTGQVYGLCLIRLRSHIRLKAAFANGSGRNGLILINYRKCIRKISSKLPIIYISSFVPSWCSNAVSVRGCSAKV